MNRDLTQSERDTLESMLDASCLDAILQALSEICEEKADHIESSYADKATARMWRAAGGRIGVCSVGSAIVAVSHRAPAF